MLKLGKTMSEAVSSGPVDRKAWFIMVLSCPMKQAPFVWQSVPVGTWACPKRAKIRVRKTSLTPKTECKREEIKSSDNCDS